MGLRERRRRRPVTPRLRRGAAERRRGRTRRDRLRRAEVHHAHRERRRARRRADGSALRDAVRRAGPHHPAGRVLRSARCDARRLLVPVRRRRCALRRRGLGGAAVLPAAGDHPEQARDGRGGGHHRRDRHVQSGGAAGRDRQDVPGVGRCAVASGVRSGVDRSGAAVDPRHGRPAHRRGRHADPGRPEQRGRHRTAEADQRRAGRLRVREELHRLVRHVRREQPVRRRPGGCAGQRAVVPECAVAVCRADPDRGGAVQGQRGQPVLRRRRLGLRHPGGC